VFPGVHLRRERHEGDTANENKKYSHEFFLSGLVDFMGLLSAGGVVNVNFTVNPAFPARKLVKTHDYLELRKRKTRDDVVALVVVFPA